MCLVMTPFDLDLLVVGVTTESIGPCIAADAKRSSHGYWGHSLAIGLGFRPLSQTEAILLEYWPHPRRLHHSWPLGLGLSHTPCYSAMPSPPGHAVAASAMGVARPS